MMDVVAESRSNGPRGALKGFLDEARVPLSHIKPHGALYGMASRSGEVAHAVCDAAEVFGVSPGAVAVTTARLLSRPAHEDASVSGGRARCHSVACS